MQYAKYPRLMNKKKIKSDSEGKVLKRKKAPTATTNGITRSNKPFLPWPQYICPNPVDRIVRRTASHFFLGLLFTMIPYIYTNIWIWHMKQNG